MLDPQIDDHQVHFEIIIQNEFLRGKLKDHLYKHNITNEKDIILNYTLKLKEPKKIRSDQQQDWIKDIVRKSRIDIHNDGFYSLTIDGVVHIYDHQNKLIKQSKVGSAISNCLSVLDNDCLLVGQQNCQLAVYKIEQKTSNLVEIGCDDSNEGGVVSIDKHPLIKDMVITGDTLGNLTFYKINEQYLHNKDGLRKPNNKKVKLENQKHLEYLSKQKVSNQQVNRISWCNDDQCVLGLMESKIVILDVNQKESVQNLWTRDSAVFSLDCINTNCIMSGHEDGFVRVWDQRVNVNKPQMSLKAHHSIVSSVNYHPSNQYLFNSTGYDCSGKVFDIRSSFSLFSF